MSNSFYTNVQVWGSRILYRGVENGKRIREKIDYHPKLYVPSQKPTQFRTIYGEHLAEMKPGNIRDCRDFVNKYEDVQGFKIYGNQRYEYQYIAENTPEHVEWDIEHVNISNIDIEVGSENGFPEPAEASETITAITIKNNQGKFIVFGCGEFNNSRSDIRYVKCRDELDLIKRFIDEWTGDYPDIITGWNIRTFDIVYLVNRIIRVLGEDWAKRLSPWGVITQREVQISEDKYVKVWQLLGIAIIDYLEAYKKFAPKGKSQESYKLDAICSEEIGEKKLSYEEYGSLHKLYKENYQLFIEYNIRDVELVDKLDDYLRLMELILTLAYDSKSNYEDAFAQVRMWDAIIYNYLLKDNIIVPPSVAHKKDKAYVGAYVKEPQLGMHHWLASFDLDSLYPHLIMQWNISPETLIEPEKYNDIQRSILDGGVNVDRLLSRSIDLSLLNQTSSTLTPNGQFFRTDRQGFLAKIMEEMYVGRSAYKKKSLEAKKAAEAENNETKKAELKKMATRFHNLQLAKKVCLNSAYGASGNQYFRFFDVRLASAITTAGQLAIRWIENHINEYLNDLLKTGDKDYVIASDTDSLYITLSNLVRRTFSEEVQASEPNRIIAFMDKVCKTVLQSRIDESYRSLSDYVNAYGQKMRMKREALADRGIWTGKKHYALKVYDNEGVVYATPEMKIMGMEMIKSTTPAACRVMLKEGLNIIMNRSEQEMIDYIAEKKEEFKKLPIEQIAIPKGVNGLATYRNDKTIFGFKTPIHVRGSLVYNHILKEKKLSKKYQLIQEGEKIKYVYLLQPNTIQSNVIAFPMVLPPELDLHKYIDYEVQFEKTFLGPLRKLLEVIGWKSEHVSTLEDFFS